MSDQNTGSTGFFSLFARSAREFSSLRSLAGAALLLALCIVLSMFNIQITPSLKIGFSFLAYALSGMLYGPAVGLATGVLCDVIQYLLVPSGAYFPGFTLNAALTGFIFGLMLYPCRPTLPRIIIARCLTNIIINIGLGTLWNSILLGKGFWLLLPSRLLKNLIMLPVEIILLYFLLNAVLKILPRIGRSEK